MARYEVEYSAVASKGLRGVPPADVRRILARIDALRDDPRPMGVEKMTGQERYRLRQGDYRILYTISDATATIRIVRVGHRRDVYRER